MIQDILPHHFDNTFQSKSYIEANDFVFHFRDNALLLKKEKGEFHLPRKEELNSCASEGIFMFELNHTACFLVWDCESTKNAMLAYYEVSFRNPFCQKEIDWSAGVALQLKNWYQAHKFCGKCGSVTKHKQDERAILCPSCKSILFPHISPAIIVAILCEDKILLARGASFPEGYFSLIAGYLDVGESIEDAVRREVREEVGVEIKNIRYYNSQPWPFSGSMMIGFIAEAKEHQDIKIDGLEILEADWFQGDKLPNYPPDRSIAGEIIEKFKQKVL